VVAHFTYIRTDGHCTLPHKEKPLVLCTSPPFGVVKGKTPKNLSDYPLLCRCVSLLGKLAVFCKFQFLSNFFDLSEISSHCFIYV
jgi:hypothetical protein